MSIWVSSSKDVLAHVADWEWVGVEGLRHMAAGQSPQVEHIADIDAWNQAHSGPIPSVPVGAGGHRPPVDLCLCRARP
jgi:hypothetical protein